MYGANIVILSLSIIDISSNDLFLLWSYHSNCSALAKIKIHYLIMLIIQNRISWATDQGLIPFKDRMVVERDLSISSDGASNVVAINKLFWRIRYILSIWMRSVWHNQVPWILSIDWLRLLIKEISMQHWTFMNTMQCLWPSLDE